MSALMQFAEIVTGCCGAEKSAEGSYRLDFVNGSSRQATAEEIVAATNKAAWAAQATARKDRAAQAAIAEPASTDPAVLQRKLDAALYLLGK